ncbi:MAG: 4-hydroxy-tetrahydrodipicolinate reductase [Armatimonadetes bacterium]|nr:4-hydroxy-tetrahydrodipicolinate reductase [Armatimonadota bacterium]
MAEKIRVLVTGACGNMGQHVVRAVSEAKDMELVGAVDPAGVDKDIGEVALGGPIGLKVLGHLPAALEHGQPDVMVDFTHPDVVMGNLEVALKAGVYCVVGTTGLSETDLKIVEKLCRNHDVACLIAPNFSLGANLMMRFAAEAARHYEYAEIIERHHERKADAPSGTALKTAELMEKARGEPLRSVSTSHEKVPGSRGGETAGLRVHSVRLPGYVANQEVIFGGQGELLIIESISTSRECFMPGVLLAVRAVRDRKGLVYGLDQLL